LLPSETGGKKVLGKRHRNSVQLTGVVKIHFQKTNLGRGEQKFKPYQANEHPNEHLRVGGGRNKKGKRGFGLRPKIGVFLDRAAK